MKREPRGNGPRLGSRLELGIVFAVLAAVLSGVALSRFVATDEGFYTLAAQEVMQGERPYRDFFYPQMPLLPYVYGVWLRLFGFTWTAGRILSALLAAGAGTLLYWRLRETAGRGPALAAPAMFLLSGMVVVWFTPVKTYSLTALLLVSAWAALHAGARSGSRWPFALAGFFLVLAVEVRLPMAVLVPVLPILILRDAKDRQSAAPRLLAFGAGAAIAAVPGLMLAIPDLDAFWFNNLGFHLLRQSYELADSAPQKLATALEVLGVRESRENAGYQLPVLILVNLAYVALCRINRSRIDSAWWMAAALLVAGFAPTPSWLQYFSVLVPFLVVGAALTIPELRRLPLFSRSAPFRRLAGAVGLVAGVIYLHGVFVNGERFTRSGEKAFTYRRTRLETVSAVTREIDARTRPGERVLSHWPGYLFGSHARIVDGTENQFSVRVEGKLTEEQLARYRLLSSGQRVQLIRSGAVRLAVLHPAKAAPRMMESAGFRPVVEAHGVVIFERQEGSPTRSDRQRPMSVGPGGTDPDP